jgi:RNase P subunit RPR2
MATTVTPTAYCVKCAKTQEIKNPQAVTLKNGRPSVQGTCPICGTKLVRFVSSKA